MAAAIRHANGVDVPKMINGVVGTAYGEDSIKAPRVLGQHEARTLAGQHMVDNTDRLEEMHPALGRHILENGFGGITSQSGMGYRGWALQTMGVLTAMGDCTDQVQVYLEAALRHGATEQEVLGVFSHAASFAGAPRAVNSVRRCDATLRAARKFPELSMKEKVVQLHDHETLVRDSGGSGVPVLLVHALSMDGRMFQDLIPRLATSGQRVIAYDMRGHGYARGSPLTESLEHLASDLEELINVLRIDWIDVVGASYGGAVAQYFTLKYPSRVRSLCAMATGAKGHPELASRGTRAENGEMPALRTEAIIRWFRPETIADNPWYVRYARATLERVRVEEWAAAWSAMARLDTMDRIKEIERPILVLCGSKDLSSTPARMKPIHDEAVKAGRDSTYVELPEGTHMMSMESPTEVAAALKSFLKRVEGKTTN